MEEEVLDKYEVEESKRGTFKGKGDLLEWRRVRKNKIFKIRIESEEKIAGREFSPCSENTTCSVCKASRRR